MEVDGHEIGPPLVDSGAHVGAGEEGPVSEVALHTRCDIGRRGQGQNMDDLDVFELGSARHHRVDQQGRGVAAGVDPHAVAGPDVLDSFIRGHDTSSEDTVPVHHAPSVAVDGVKGHVEDLRHAFANAVTVVGVGAAVDR